MAAPEPTATTPAELGPFSIRGILGEGGSAIVYLAEWQGREVALKVPRDRELTAREQERFLEEARLLQRVRHRGVVEALDAGRLPDGLPYLVMQRHEGTTLAEHLAAHGALGLDHALDLFEQLASAVEALHDAGLLHRDLKPENLLVVDGGRTVKLLDFGIAKEMDAPASTTTQAGIARGTPATMAPERFFGAPASKSTDVYELAVVFYAMLVGRLPWKDVTNVQARLNPLSPLEAGALVPEALSTTVMEALSTRPERRPPDVGTLVARVRESVRTRETSGRVTAATRVSAPPPSLEPQRSEDAQVIESRRDVAAPASRARLLGTAAVLALVVAGAAAVVVARTGAAPGASAAPPADAPATAPPVPASTAAPAPSSPVESPRPASTAATPVTAPRGKPTASSAPSAAPAPSSQPAPARGKPKGAPCTRSSECASMVCAAEVCQ